MTLSIRFSIVIMLKGLSPALVVVDEEAERRSGMLRGGQSRLPPTGGGTALPAGCGVAHSSAANRLTAAIDTAGQLASSDWTQQAI